MPSSPNPPIFIQGILQRCGSNFLNELLLLHPDVHRCGAIYEDFLLRPAGLLAQYSEAVFESYPPHWPTHEKAGGPEALLNCLGDGLLEWLRRQVDEETALTKRLLTKTPRAENLRYFFPLFPEAQVLLLVRDCRSVVESGVRSFNWQYDQAMQLWVHGAREILDFMERERERPERWMLLRYEDLYNRTEESMHAILRHLNLSEEAYDFSAACNLPVMGSSDGRNEEGRFQFKSMSRSEKFDPLNRAAGWDEEKNRMMQEIAGEAMRELGYA